MTEMRTALDAYMAAFDAMGPDRLDVFDAVCDPDIRFVDPFNDVRGLDRFKGVFWDMYQTLDQPRFTIVDSALGDRAGYIRWHFEFAMRGRAMAIDGMSEVVFGPDGRVVEHIDHWDSGSQVYGRIPVLGSIIGFVRRRFSA